MYQVNSFQNCSNCVKGKFCLPLGLSTEEMKKIDQLTNKKYRLKKGEEIYRQGDVFKSLFSIRYGSFKTEHLLNDGRSQIIGFHLPGEILGLDGIGNNFHESNAVTLEDSEVCVMKFSELETLSQHIPSFNQHFHKIMSREITQDHRHQLTLGSRNAEEKLSCFFLKLYERLTARGLTTNEFNLVMGREEIGSYLGLEIETISRTLSKFSHAGLIEAHHKHIKLLNVIGLTELAN